MLANRFGDFTLTTGEREHIKVIRPTFSFAEKCQAPQAQPGNASFFLTQREQAYETMRFTRAENARRQLLTKRSMPGRHPRPRQKRRRSRFRKQRLPFIAQNLQSV